MIAALEARELNKNLKEKVYVEGFQDVWSFDRLPYSDLARNSSPTPEEKEVKSNKGRMTID